MDQETEKRMYEDNAKQAARPLKSITIRQVSNGYMTEKISMYGLGSNHDMQKGAAIHKTPAEVAAYINDYLLED